MSYKTILKCPYCGKEKEYRVSDYDTSKLVSMATGRGTSYVTIRCKWCGKDYKVSCNIRYYGRKRGLRNGRM
jgi:transcription elongation factor Elf1